MSLATDVRAPARDTTPTERILTGSLLVAPLVYLAADTVYAIRGWDDAAAGVLHVLGAIAYGFVLLRVAGWLPRDSVLAAAVVVTGLVGLGGNVGFGFDTIHLSLGDTALVDQPGAANLIKPLGLFFPLSCALAGIALVRLGRAWQGALLIVAMIGWPVAHIGNVAPLAVAVNVAAVVALGSLVWATAPDAQEPATT
jgi:hypothetical protein